MGSTGLDGVFDPYTRATPSIYDFTERTPMVPMF